jgi:hypothetical protein
MEVVVMKIHYCLPSNLVINNENGILDTLEKAGVGCIWLYGYFFGHYESTIEEMLQAKEILETRGFEVGVANLPVGHPGNSLNPEDETLNLKIPEHWRYKIDRFGNPVYFTADIEKNMIEDNAAAVELLSSNGFTKIFMDDDLRLGDWGDDIQGCFCDICIEGFNRIHSENQTRETLRQAVEEKSNPVLLQKWCAYNCDKVSLFCKEISKKDTTVGIMVGHCMDERHGIDLKDIQNSMRECMIRVGECGFDDQSFGNPYGKAFLLSSLLFHKSQVLRNNSVFSETTVFPPRALKPENLIYKAKLELTYKIDNIFVMSGTWVIDESYWRLWSDELPAMKLIHEACSQGHLSYPVHIVKGTHGAYGEKIMQSTLPLLAGLPAIPARACDTLEGGEILCAFGDYRLGEDWRRKFKGYKLVILDTKAAETNEDVISDTSYSNVYCWQNEVAINPDQREGAELQRIIDDACVDFPRLTDGFNAGLAWLKNINKIILYNMEEKLKTVTVAFYEKKFTILLKPLEFKIVSIEEYIS